MRHFFRWVKHPEASFLSRALAAPAAVVFLLCCFFVHAADLPDQVRGPIHITADRLETFDGGRLVVFSGAVEASQDMVTVNSDRLLIYYLTEPGSGEAITDGGMEKIEAEGSVVIKSEDAVMTGDFAVLHYGDETIVMVGDRAVLREGDNVVEGGTITWYLAEGRGLVEDREGGRVTATIHQKKNGHSP